MAVSDLNVNITELSLFFQGVSGRLSGRLRSQNGKTSIDHDIVYETYIDGGAV